ncbi:hypothetical protein CDO52_13145 [Nocardiopsis gilva YIM 90087]|uniref:Uncharacterized protein n=1 Tax=Nocardiopsis gilva YIM 90087 TaxID=1235441 RepID=A0A223S630_9ACTN|nr:hypothetical protein [Nocardiopsis gilva]ASU83613.1 hypothetical protein CDO52_13145 [Nocardiopsis gilva YIM 90087]
MSGSSYHYVMTLQAPVGSAAAVHTQSGTLTVPAGTTRAQVYTHVVEVVRRELPDGAGEPTVLFWSLEPNLLGGDR